MSFAVVSTSMSLTPPPLRLPGLDPAARYRVEHLSLPGEQSGPNRSRPYWLDAGSELTGTQLANHGVQLPAMHPETALVLHLRRA